MSRNAITFAYIVSGDLPGAPVKIGLSQKPRHRFDNIRRAVPFRVRFLGVTLDGAEREQQMFDATADRVIRTDWRYPTPALFGLVRKWIEAGEWFLPSASPNERFAKARVAERIECVGYAAPPRYDGTTHWRDEILKAAAHDPTLGLDWDGFERSSQFPEFSWLERATA